MRGRVTAMTFIILVLFGLILGQAVFIQVHRASALNADPANPRNAANAIIYQRGEILSSNGTVLAKSVPAGAKASYPWQRVYPLGSLTSQAVGYMSYYYGTGGLEYQYNSYLVSHSQPARSISQLLAPAHSADSVHLTLEIALQQVAARALAGRDGAVVALDPRSGAVLGMYSNPTFNPAPLTSQLDAPQIAAWTSYSKPDAIGFRPFRPMATAEYFPPGSTSKIVTTAAVNRYWPGLILKSYPVQTCLQLPNGNPAQPLCNSGGSPCGGTIPVMLPESCDPGYAEVALDLGGVDLANQARDFGYDATPPLDLGPLGGGSSVIPSYFPTGAQLNANLPFLAYSGIGQGNVRATALQDALVAAGIANHGEVLAPHLMSSITDALGNVVASYKDTLWRRALGPVETAQIVPMMQNVVLYGTAAGVGFLPQDQVAAKTGTAQTGVGNTNTDDWMIAFAPATRPLVAVAVVVPHQTLFDWGATVAGPIVKCVIEAQLAIDSGQPPAGTATTCQK